MADEKPWKVVEIAPVVQQLAASTHTPPSQYVVPDQHDRRRPSMAGSRMPEPLPIVNLQQLSAPDNSHEVAKLRAAVENWGLFLAVGHGMDPSFLGEVMNTSREFFELPVEEKHKYSNSVNGKEDFRLQGYGNDMVISEDQILDWCDRYYLTVEPESQRIYSLWPTQPPCFREILSEYTIKCREIANHVLKNLARLLGLQDGYFINKLGKNAMTNARFNYYPHCPREILSEYTIKCREIANHVLKNLARLLGLQDGYFINKLGKNAMAHARFNYYPHCPRPDHVLGMKPHTDATMITIIFVDDTVTGLQLKNNGVWYDVPIIPNALLVNVGDTIEIMSNGLFKSPVHRVVTNAEKERLSLAMFYVMDSEGEMEPAPELVDENRPRLYRKMETKDYTARLFENFARGTLSIDAVKI